MLHFPQDIIPKNREEREHIDSIAIQRRDMFQATILKDRKKAYTIPIVQKLPLDIFPISQQFSGYSFLPYGLFGTIGQAGCGPLAVEYAFRLLGFSVDLEEIVSECVEKGYRGYIYDDDNNIVDGSGTKYALFSNIATELSNLEEIIRFLEKGCPITVLIQNDVYNDDENRTGNHFVTLVGIDSCQNAILMDGNTIIHHANPYAALQRRPFHEMLLGLKGAWAWEKEKVKAYLK